jgi:flavin-dependent thymidylate synthase
MTSENRALPAKFADVAMFQAEAFDGVDLTTGVVPSVRLLWMTPDPLGAIASMAAMYEGRVIRDLSELGIVDRKKYFEDVLSTHLDTPLEAVKFQFLYEGVDRATTHQVVRARHQTYAQESLRFAVVDDLSGGTSLPPSLWGTDPELDPFNHPSPEEQALHEMRQVWDDALAKISEAYTALIDRGMPAEEARGLLPHATATRMVVVTDLRTLKAEAGNRLCTQAQFHWRILFGAIVDAIRNYGSTNVGGGLGEIRDHFPEHQWQYAAIADSSLFRPVCYQIGKCPFKASFDRACSIRGRVDLFERHGIPSSQWDDGSKVINGVPIKNEEWLMDPSAARRSS